MLDVILSNEFHFSAVLRHHSRIGKEKNKLSNFEITYEIKTKKLCTSYTQHSHVHFRN